MPLVYCKICRKKFYAKPNWLKKGWGKYCSQTCQSKAQLKGKFVYCDICKKKIWRSPKQLARSKSGKFFCNKAHHMAWKNQILQTGENHPNWKGGESMYRKILTGNNISPICARCRKRDKRVLSVHHKDGNRRNNKIKNLVWLCLNCHHLVQRYNEPINK